MACEYQRSVGNACQGLCLSDKMRIFFLLSWASFTVFDNFWNHSCANSVIHFYRKIYSKIWWMKHIQIRYKMSLTNPAYEQTHSDGCPWSLAWRHTQTGITFRLEQGLICFWVGEIQQQIITNQQNQSEIRAAQVNLRLIPTSNYWNREWQINKEGERVEN